MDEKSISHKVNSWVFKNLYKNIFKDDSFFMGVNNFASYVAERKYY